MKIAIVSSGSSIHVKKIANELVKRGHDLTLYTMPNHMKLIDDFDKKINIVKLPVKAPFGYYLNSLVLRKMLESENYDLINAHYASGYGTLVRLANVHPIALAVFGSDVFEYPYKSKTNMNRIIKNLDAAEVITSTSYVMKEEVEKFYHRNREIYVTPFGVDLNRFHPMNVEKKGGFEFGIVKKIDHKYGIDVLLKAFRKFKDKYPDLDTRLNIYGRGPALEEYKALSQDLGLSDCVSFKGFIQNELVPEALAQMDVAVYSSSSSESFGVAVVEAMACGVPVIASDASGFTEVMEEGKTGFLFPKQDVDALCAAMIKMYELSPDDRRQMGIAGVERVKRLYNFNENMDEYEIAIMHAVKK